MVPKGIVCNASRTSRLASAILVGLLIFPTGASLGQVQEPRPVGQEETPMDTFQEGPSVHGSPSFRGFTANGGQMEDDQVRFYIASKDRGVLFYDHGLTMIWDGGPASPSDGDIPSAGAFSTLDLSFAGGRARYPEAARPLPGISTYFIGSDPANWVRGVRTFERLTYRDVWEGIDIVYRIEGGKLKYDVVVGAGADPSQIHLRYQGQSHMGILQDGSLAVGNRAGDVIEMPPVAFLEEDPSQGVDCEFVLRGVDGYGFRIGSYDRDAVLVIDPLVDSTFIGGSDRDDASSVAITDEGDLLVVGYSRSLDIPVTNDSIQSDMHGGCDAYVAVLDKNLSQMKYCTYIGGSEWDYGRDVVSDGTGAIYIAGSTMSYDFPTTNGTFQTSHAGSWDVFVCKLEENGTQMSYSTLLGGKGKDHASYLPDIGIDVDDKGSVYVSGSTGSDDFPTTTGALNRTRAGGEDVYVSKLHPSGGSLVYSTLVGGTGNDYCHDMVVSESGEVFICGETTSTDLPTTEGSYQENHTGDWSDMFVGAVTEDGDGLVYLTHVGSWGSDAARSLALDGNGSTYVHGFTQGSDFPTTKGAYQEKTSGNGDTVVFKLDPEGEKLEYSTFLGGTAYEDSGAISIDAVGNAYMVGRTSSSDFPTTTGCDQDIFRGGGYDCYVSSLSPDGDELLFSTYMGMTRLDVAIGTVFDGRASLFVCGQTDSSNFPTSSGAIQPTYGGGGGDGFVQRFILDVVPPLAEAGEDVVIDQHENVTFDGTGCVDNLGIANLTWRFSYDGQDVVLGGVRPSFTFHTAGEYVVNLTVRDLSDNIGWDLVKVTVLDITPPAARAGDDITIHQHQSVLFDGSGSSDNVGVVSWDWTFVYGGEDVVLTGPKPSFTFQEAGEYEVVMNVTDAAGNWATDGITVRVIDTTAPEADAGRDLLIDQGDTVTFDGSASQDNVDVTNWTWTFEYGGANIALYGARPDFTFDEPGIYSIGLRVQDAMGLEDTDSIIVEVRDTERPVANAGEDLWTEQDRTVVFNGSLSSDNVGIESFEWSFDYDNMTVRLKGISPNFFFHTAGTYTIMLVVTDHEGNWGSDFVAVTVRDVTPPIADAGTDMTIDQHQEVTFDGTGSWDDSGDVRWAWEFSYRGTDFTLGGPEPSFRFDEAGTVEVALTVSDPSNNEDSDSVTVTVRDTTPPEADPGEDLTVSQHDTVELNGTRSTDNVGIVEWEWNLLDDGMTMNLYGEVQRYVFPTPGVYDVKLTVTDVVGLKGTGIVRVTVRDTTPPVAVCPEDMTLEAGDQVHLDGSGSEDNVGITEYRWAIRYEGSSHEDVLLGKTVDYSFERPGTYEVTLTVTDAEGNTGKEAFVVTAEGGISNLWLLLAIVISVAAGAILYVLKRKQDAQP